MNALVVGSGPWAQFLFQRISQEPEIDVNTIPARKLREVLSSGATHENHWDLVLCATRPQLQEALLPILAKYSKYLWLEKPIAETTKGCEAILESLNKHKSVAMVNLPWNYSQAWRTFKSISPDRSKVSKIEISRCGIVGERSYLSIIEDYGTHDLCLCLDWIDSSLGETQKLRISENGYSAFNGSIQGINISWNWEKARDQKEMKWKIFDKEGNRYDLDFYRSTVHVNAIPVNVEKTSADNISTFLKTLLTGKEEDRKKNLMIAISVKKLFIKALE